MKKSNGALESRAASALNMVMNDYQVSCIIAGAEQRIVELDKRLREKDEPRQKAFEVYEKLQAEYDAIKSRLHDDEILLESMSKYKNNLKQSSSIRIIRAESHNDMKDREKKKHAATGRGIRQFTWIAYAVKTLGEQGRMMLPGELWELVVKRFDIAGRLQVLGYPPEKLNSKKVDAMNTCWKGNIQVTMGGGHYAEKTGKLFQNGDYIGLKEWADENWQPRPEYIKNEIRKAV